MNTEDAVSEMRRAMAKALADQIANLIFRMPHRRVDYATQKRLKRWARKPLITYAALAGR